MLNKFLEISICKNFFVSTDYEILYYYRYCLTLNSMKRYQLQRLKKWLLSVSESEQREIDEEQTMNEHKLKEEEKPEPHISFKNNIFDEETKHKRIHICYVKNDCITFAGFVQLHLILVQMLQHDCIWKSLEKFGYKRKDLSISQHTMPTTPNKQQFAKYCTIHNPILRPNIKELMSKHCKSRLQYELSPNISGFLMSIFLKYCENPHDEYNDNNIENINGLRLTHEYSTCFITPYGLDKLLENYNLKPFPFETDDLVMVGSIINNNKNNKKNKCDTITLTAWLSLWSLLMCYETETALKCLTIMGAPTMFPSDDFNPKWIDYSVPQIACSPNTHQRFFKCLIVTYPFNDKLVNQFIRASVNDFSRSDTLSHNQYPNQYATLQHIDDYQSNQNENNQDEIQDNQNQTLQPRQNRHRQQTKIPAASRTGSLSPIREATKDELTKSPPHFSISNNNNGYYQDDNKYQNEEEKFLYENDKKGEKITNIDNESIQRLNTTFFLVPQDRSSNETLSYGMLNDELDCRQKIYDKHINFVHKNTMNKRKPLIPVNLLVHDRGIDAYHTLFESWCQYSQNESSGQDHLFEFDAKCNDQDDGFIDKKLEKDLRCYDCIIYLHTTNSIKYTKNIKRLFNICRDQQMPIIPVNIPFDVASTEKTNGSKKNQLSHLNDHPDVQQNDENEIDVIDIDPDCLSPTNTNTKIITGQGTTSHIGTRHETKMKLKHEQSREQLNEMLEYYDLPQRVIEWESFPEDQSRFTRDLIDDIHHREYYIPKTLWQIRKTKAYRYAKKGTVFAMGLGLAYYFAPVDSMYGYLGFAKRKNMTKNKKSNQKSKRIELKTESSQMKSVRTANRERRHKQSRHKQKSRSVKLRKEKDKDDKRGNKSMNPAWKSLIAVSILTSVFCGGYMIYKYRTKNMNKWNKKQDIKQKQNQDEDDELIEEEEEDDENSSKISYLMSLFFPRFEDEANEDEDDDLSLTSFGFLKRRKPDGDDNENDDII